MEAANTKGNQTVTIDLEKLWVLPQPGTEVRVPIPEEGSTSTSAGKRKMSAREIVLQPDDISLILPFLIRFELFCDQCHDFLEDADRNNWCVDKNGKVRQTTPTEPGWSKPLLDKDKSSIVALPIKKQLFDILLASYNEDVGWIQTQYIQVLKVPQKEWRISNALKYMNDNFKISEEEAYSTTKMTEKIDKIHMDLFRIQGINTSNPVFGCSGSIERLIKYIFESEKARKSRVGTPEFPTIKNVTKYNITVDADQSRFNYAAFLLFLCDKINSPPDFYTVPGSSNVDDPPDKNLIQVVNTIATAFDSASGSGVVSFLSKLGKSINEKINEHMTEEAQEWIPKGLNLNYTEYKEVGLNKNDKQIPKANQLDVKHRPNEPESVKIKLVFRNILLLEIVYAYDTNAFGESSNAELNNMKKEMTDNKNVYTKDFLERKLQEAKIPVKKTNTRAEMIEKLARNQQSMPQLDEGASDNSVRLSIKAFFKKRGSSSLFPIIETPPEPPPAVPLGRTMTDEEQRAQALAAANAGKIVQERPGLYYGLGEAGFINAGNTIKIKRTHDQPGQGIPRRNGSVGVITNSLTNWFKRLNNQNDSKLIFESGLIPYLVCYKTIGDFGQILRYYSITDTNIMIEASSDQPRGEYDIRQSSIVIDRAAADELEGIPYDGHENYISFFITFDKLCSRISSLFLPYTLFENKNEDVFTAPLTGFVKQEFYLEAFNKDLTENQIKRAELQTARNLISFYYGGKTLNYTALPQTILSKPVPTRTAREMIEAFRDPHPMGEYFKLGTMPRVPVDWNTAAAKEYQQEQRRQLASKAWNTVVSNLSTIDDEVPGVYPIPVDDDEKEEIARLQADAERRNPTATPVEIVRQISGSRRSAARLVSPGSVGSGMSEAARLKQVRNNLASDAQEALNNSKNAYDLLLAAAKILDDRSTAENVTRGLELDEARREEQPRTSFRQPFPSAGGGPSSSSFGKAYNKLKNTSIEIIKNKLKSVGILITKVTNTGKRIPLTKKELERKAMVFTKLQMAAKSKGIRITYKARNGSKKHKSLKRLLSDIKKYKSNKMQMPTKMTMKMKTKVKMPRFGATRNKIRGFDLDGRPYDVPSKEMAESFYKTCREAPGADTSREQNYCKYEVYCNNIISPTNDPDWRGPGTVLNPVLGFKPKKTNSGGMFCAPVYRTPQQATSVAIRMGQMFGVDGQRRGFDAFPNWVKNTILNSMQFFTQRSAYERAGAIQRIQQARLNRERELARRAAAGEARRRRSITFGPTSVVTVDRPSNAGPSNARPTSIITGDRPSNMFQLLQRNQAGPQTFGKSGIGYDALQRPQRVLSKKEKIIENGRCINDPATLRSSRSREFCRNEMYCQNLKLSKDRGHIGYFYTDPRQDTGMIDYMSRLTPGCSSLYDTKENATRAFTRGRDSTTSKELYNTLLNSHEYFTNRTYDEKAALNHLKDLRRNRRDRLIPELVFGSKKNKTKAKPNKFG